MKLLRTLPLALSLAAQPAQAAPPQLNSDEIDNVLDCYFSTGFYRVLNNASDIRDAGLGIQLSKAFWYYRGILDGQGVDINTALPKFLEKRLNLKEDREANTMAAIKKAETCVAAANIDLEP